MARKYFKMGERPFKKKLLVTLKDARTDKKSYKISSQEKKHK